MQNAGKTDKADKTDAVVGETRTAMERLAAEAQRLKRLAELHALKASRVTLSVDVQSLLETSKHSHEENHTFGTLPEMINLLSLMAVRAD